MGRFNLKDVIKNIEEYKKPIKKGDYVYILNTQQAQVYEGKAIYKVVYYDKERKRILVEIDFEKNKVDNKYINGFHRFEDLSKLYLWVYIWKQVLSCSHILNNE